MDVAMPGSIDIDVFPIIDFYESSLQQTTPIRFLREGIAERMGLRKTLYCHLSDKMYLLPVKTIKSCSLTNKPSWLPKRLDEVNGTNLHNSDEIASGSREIMPIDLVYLVSEIRPRATWLVRSPTSTRAMDLRFSWNGHTQEKNQKLCGWQ